MGMFDEVICNYPLPDGHNSLAGWQTKDTPNQDLDWYTITEDGRLLESHHTHTGIPERPWSQSQAEEVEPPFDGDIYFYTNDDEGKWVEYCAAFRYGRVIEMRRQPSRWEKDN